MKTKLFINQNLTQPLYFQDIKLGEIFKHGDDFYLKVSNGDIDDDCKYQGVSLTNFFISHFGSKCEVETIKESSINIQTH